MEVNGTLVPRPSVFPSRLGHQVSVKRERCFCFCVLRVLPVGDTLSTSSHHRWRKVEVQCQDSSQSVQQSLIPQRDDVGSSQLSFDRLQPREEDFTSEQKRGFGRFVVREAVLDEEYWTAAWLRAESCWENHSYMRHVESYKRKFAEQEFNALKQRCAGQFKNSLKCFCIVAVKKEEENVRRTVLNSIVGTLDVSIRQFLQGEAFPGIREKGYGKSSALMASNGSDHPHRYAYVSNVCVAKYARRQGIATNMLYLAMDVALSAGMTQIFVHVNADNTPAKYLYEKVGFEMVEEAVDNSSKEPDLMCLKL